MDRGAWWATVHGVTKELDMTAATLAALAVAAAAEFFIRIKSVNTYKEFRVVPLTQ